MTGHELESLLTDLLEAIGRQHVCDDRCRERGCGSERDEDWKSEFDSTGDLAECDVITYQCGGVLTNDAGLTLRLMDGSEFQITIVQTRHAEVDA